jgi:hypothetical protein
MTLAIENMKTVLSMQQAILLVKKGHMHISYHYIFCFI